jgi:AcrR family transcriptional regulator
MKLLEAAIDLLAAKGADALEMKEVARTARVSRAMAYRHFKDREHLLREAKLWLSDRLLDSMVNSQSTSIEDQVYQAAKLVLGNREASRLWIADAFSGKTLDPEHPFGITVVQTLEHLRLSGSVRGDSDVEVLTTIMLGVVAMLIMLGQQHEGANVEDLARRFTAEWTRILRHGLFAEDGRPAAETPSTATRLSAPSKTPVWPSVESKPAPVRRKARK